MHTAEITEMFTGINDPTKNILARILKPELTSVIKKINEYLATNKLSINALSPPPKDIFNAFRLCPIDKVIVVIFAQDPYINLGEAMGLAFSVRKGIKKPPSVGNIFKCLLHCKLISEIPTHGDLTSWAEQGVLLINTAFTTVLKKSNQHTEIWREFSQKLIKYISSRGNIVFILLGGVAQNLTTFIEPGNKILTWGHPSPMNDANKNEDNPKNFKYCTCFKETNEFLVNMGKKPINWNSICGGEIIINNVINNNEIIINNVINNEINNEINDKINDKINEKITNTSTIITNNEPLFTPTTIAIIRDADENDVVLPNINQLWVFTDGASKANGKAHCRASYGFYMTDGIISATECGMVNLVTIPNKVYQTSNQRGELSAVLAALQFINNNLSAFSAEEIIFCVDSEYSQKSIWEYVGDYTTTGEIRANLDIINPARDLRKKLEQIIKLSVRHIGSHDKNPLRPDDIEYCCAWSGNDIADKLCSSVLT